MVEGWKLGLVGRVVLGAGAVGGLVFNSGCSDYGNAVSRGVGEYALMEGVAGVVRNEAEGPRGTVVNVGGGGDEYDINMRERLRELDRETEERNEKRGRIMMRRWKDLDGDGVATREELLGEISDSVNMSNMGLYIVVDYYTNAGTSIKYTLLDSDDNIIVTRCIADGSWLLHSNKLFEGKYVVLAQYEGATSSREFTVAR